MAQLGSGSGSGYPAVLDTAGTEIDAPNAGKTKARADVPNDLYAAVVAVETELGTDPAGSTTDVKTFLQTEHNADGTHGTVTGDFNGDTVTASGIVSVDDTTQSTSATTGSIHTDGGLGVAKDTFIGGGADITGSVTVGGTVVSTGGIQTDGTNTLKTTVINIGDWDMDATANVSVAHGLTLAKIRAVTALIRNDGGTDVRPINAISNTTSNLMGGLGETNATNVRLNRVTGEGFDDVAYDSTSYNRGWIIITHTA